MTEFTTEVYEELSRRLFVSLCTKVRGHVFTRPNVDTDSIYVNIKKGNVIMECGVFDISHYTRYYGQIDYDHMTEWMTKKVIGTYKKVLHERFFKNQPILTLHVTKDPFRIDDVKEDSNDDIPRKVSAGTNSSESV